MIGLTYWRRHKVSVSLQMIFPNSLFFAENCCIVSNLIEKVSDGPMNNKPVLVQLMAWRQLLYDVMSLIFTRLDLDDMTNGICDTCISAHQCWSHTYSGSEKVTTTMHVNVLQNFMTLGHQQTKHLLQNIDLKQSFQECYQRFWKLKSNVSNRLSLIPCLYWNS